MPSNPAADDLRERLGYGFCHDENVLAQLLAGNLSIAEQKEDGLAGPRKPGGAGLPNTKRTSSKIEPPPSPD